MHALAAEDGGGHSPQPVAAQVQLLQLLQPCQFTAGDGGTVTSEHWHCKLLLGTSGKHIYQTHLSCDLNLILKRGSCFRLMATS